MCRAADGDVEVRLDEDVVEGQPGEHRGEEGRPDAADQRDDHDEQLVAERVRGERVGVADGEQGERQQGTDDEGEQESEHASSDAEGAAESRQGQQVPAGRGVRDDVHVDVAGFADDRGADARAR